MRFYLVVKRINKYILVIMKDNDLNMEYVRLIDWYSQLEREVRTFIFSVLKEFGKISLNLSEQERSDDDFPVILTLYGKAGSQTIKITDVYLKDEDIYADGIDNEDDDKYSEFYIYPEQLRDVLYFIGKVLDMI